VKERIKMDVKTKNGKVIGTLTTNHSMTKEEAMELLGFTWVSDESEGDHWKNEDGDEYWSEDIA
jgi:hypothetical protein